MEPDTQNTLIEDQTMDTLPSGAELHALIVTAPEFASPTDALTYLRDRFYPDRLRVFCTDPEDIRGRFVVQVSVDVNFASQTAIGTGASIDDAVTDGLATALSYFGLKVQKPVSYVSDATSMGHMAPPSLPQSGDAPRTINSRSGDPEVGRMLEGLAQIFSGRVKTCACGPMAIKGLRTKAGAASAVWVCGSGVREHESWVDKPDVARALTL